MKTSTLNHTHPTEKFCDECGQGEDNADHKFTTTRIMGEKFVLCCECEAAYKELADELEVDA